MIPAIKEYITPKTFSTLAYVCSIVHILCGLVFTGIVIVLKEEEAGKFTCNVAPDSTSTHKAHVEKACYSKYQHNYNSPIPFYGFAILSIWFPIIVAVIYSLWVRRRVEEIDSSYNESQTEGEAENQVQNRRTLRVFYFYFFHLATRVLSGILFTVLQHTVFFPRGFEFKFNCTLLPAGFTSKIAKYASVTQIKNATIACENETASEKHNSWIIVSVLNTGFALLILVEVIRLYRRFQWSCDTEFITIYLLRNQYTRIEPELGNLQECIEFYKRQILELARTTDVCYGPKIGLDHFYINLAIHTERARHKFSRNMERHEIFHVYMEVPRHSIRLEEVRDLFYPNVDTKGESPRKILAVGRPGIGKTVLTEKIMRDWANGVDEFYHGKIAFYFKFRWFNSNELNDVTLKTFLRYGTELSDEKFEIIYEYITNHPERAILIFDGLDEFNGNVDCLDYLPPPNDPNVSMSGISLFIKLISGLLLPKATVLVTSRPTANEFYSRFTFDRTVEIIGFTSDKIEEYVRKFCENHDRGDLKPKIWNHIKSSSDLLNLCYIPVNTFIVSTILFECLNDTRNDNDTLPATLTELYIGATDHFEKHHYRKLKGVCTKEAMKKLQLLAYTGIENGQLVFSNESVDKQMKKSGLLNSLSNPFSQVQTQFCFIHLTIQEFLAARHVTETFTAERIKEFILSHIGSGKWHLVLQFMAGLLGKKNCNKNCIWTFAESFNSTNSVLDLTDYSQLFVLKCFREVDDEDIAKEACEATAMNDVMSLNYNPTLTSLPLTSSDWAAVTFVCKHMKKLTRLDLHLSSSSRECYLEVNILLQQRCTKQLKLVGSLGGSFEVKHLCKALVESKCALKHEHSKLTELNIQSLPTTNKDLSTICEFFKNGHASCLEKLVLKNLCGMSSDGVSILCEILDSKVCPELTYLDLSYNQIYDMDIKVLCDTLTKQSKSKLTHLFLARCDLTDLCLHWLCQLITDERCNLAVLSLTGIKRISDVGLRRLCEKALTKQHCKLTNLNLFNCSLTDRCIPKLRETLQDEHCVLRELTLGNCKFSEKGKNSLRELATYKRCKDRGLKIDLLGTYASER